MPACLSVCAAGIMRSVVVAIFELNAKEVFVIGHRDCGMAKIHPAGTIDKMMAAGIKPESEWRRWCRRQRGRASVATAVG